MNYEQLFSTVLNGNLEKTKVILSSGVDVNFPVKEWCGESSILHYAPSDEIVKELLLYGANVNAQDCNGRTALHIAVFQKKGLKLVKQLLENGADPNARNFQGTTALTPAIMNKDLKIIKELLNYGADINIRTISPLLRYPTPLALAVSSSEECGKLLIKITLLKKFNCDYRKFINLSLYTECRNYRKLSDYLDDCVSELVKMKTTNVNHKLTLYDFIKYKTENIKYLYNHYKVLDEELLNEYPIYQDIIIHKIKLFLKRAYLIDKLRVMHVTENEIALNSDCLCKIAEYLSDENLYGFLAAFYKDLDQSLCDSEIGIDLHIKYV